MMNPFPVAALSLVANITLGKMLDERKNKGEQTPYIRAANVRRDGTLDTADLKQMRAQPDEISSLNISKGDIFMIEGGDAGRVALANDNLPETIFQKTLMRIRAITQASVPDFLYYALNEAYASGRIAQDHSLSTIPHFPAEKAARLTIPLPDLPTQRRIADYLDRETAQIDAMAGALDGLVARLEERRVSLVTQAIWPKGVQGDTVPLRALAGADGMFTDGDWVESKDQDPNGDIRLLQLADIGDGQFRDKSDRWINSATFDKLGCTRIEQGDILIARIPHPIARAAIFPNYIPYDCVTVVDACILRTSSKVDNRYAMWSINSSPLRNDALLEIKGSTRQRISRSNLGRLRIPLPPLDEQRRIADHLDGETAKIDAMIAKAGELRALLDERRSALITATVTGQHPVPEEP